MLSLDRCREILKSANYELETEEIITLRDFLYQFATYQVEFEMECEAENNEDEKLVA
jgi:hypothetical protein